MRLLLSVFTAILFVRGVGINLVSDDVKRRLESALGSNYPFLIYGSELRLIHPEVFDWKGSGKAFLRLEW